MAARERNIVAQRFTEAYKKRGQQVAETLKCSLRRNFDICRKGRRGEKVSHRVQCQSTFASSKELSISFPVSVDEATTVDSNLEVQNFFPFFLFDFVFSFDSERQRRQL